MSGPDTHAFAPADHDHRSCVEAALLTATELCRQRGARLTRIRRQVLELVWSSHRPLGAYAILQALQQNGRPAAPPTVYRALEFLQAQGLVHKIDSLSAFVGCPRPRSRHSGQFLICGECNLIAEIDDAAIGRAVRHSASRAGFQVLHQTVEIRGLCPDCARKREP